MRIRDFNEVGTRTLGESSAIAHARVRSAAKAALLAVVIASLASPGSASGSNYAVLSPGQTTPDGRLTLVVSAAGGSAHVALKNNDVRPVIVERYRLDRGLGCDGKALTLASNETYGVCSVSSLPTANVGRPSLQMSLRWYAIRRPPPTAEPSPEFASPSPTPLH